MQSSVSTVVTSAVAARFYVPIADDECRTQSGRSSTRGFGQGVKTVP